MNFETSKIMGAIVGAIIPIILLISNGADFGIVQLIFVGVCAWGGVYCFTTLFHDSSKDE